MQHDFRDRAHPLLARLSEATESTAHLWLYDPKGPGVMVIDQAGPDIQGPLGPRIGLACSLDSSPAGKVVLAGLDPPVVDDLLTRVARGASPDLPCLREHLGKIRFQGYALDCNNGTTCLGSPVLDNRAFVIGAVSISMPISAFVVWDESQLASLVKSAAHDLQKLGLRDSPGC
jgi:DNA-binding IclR family transcriptional regulator